MIRKLMLLVISVSALLALSWPGTAAAGVPAQGGGIEVVVYRDGKPVGGPVGAAACIPPCTLFDWAGPGQVYMIDSTPSYLNISGQTSSWNTKTDANPGYRLEGRDPYVCGTGVNCAFHIAADYGRDGTRLQFNLFTNSNGDVNQVIILYNTAYAWDSNLGNIAACQGVGKSLGLDYYRKTYDSCLGPIVATQKNYPNANDIKYVNQIW